jgi:hypothetical protein
MTAEPVTAIARRGEEIEDSGLVTTSATGAELSTAADSAAVQAEIQSALVLANRLPRNEDGAFQSLIRSCRRPTFAAEAGYSFPRGGSKVTGPSVNLAREAARSWGNIRYGLEVVRDDEDNRKIRGWAWDLQTNTKVTAEDEFRKLVQRKRNNGTAWVKPDERDLRELTNRRGAILVRNCLLQLLPRDLIEDAYDTAQQTLANAAAKDPDGERKRLLAAFDAINVTAAQLEEYLGHPIKEASPAELADLRMVWKSISDGNSTWDEHAPRPSAPGKEIKTDDLLPPVKTEAAEVDQADKPRLSAEGVARITAACDSAGVEVAGLEERLQGPLAHCFAAEETDVMAMVKRMAGSPKKGNRS